MGRFVLIHRPQAIPAECATCTMSGPSQDGYVDIGLDIDFYGTMYLCKKCVTEMYNQFEHPQVDLLKELVITKAQLKVTKENMEYLKDGIDALVRGIPNNL